MARGSGNRPVRPDGTRFSFQDFFHLIHQAKPTYGLLVLGIVLLSASSAIQVYVPALASKLINAFRQGLDGRLLAWVVGLFILSAIISALGGTVLGIFGEQVIQRMRTQLWTKLTTLKMTYFDDIKAGELSSRLTNDTNQVKQLLATTFPQTIASLVTVVGTVYMMIRMDWQMSLLLLLGVPLIMLVMWPIMHFGTKISYERQDAMSRLSGLATELLTEIGLVKISNAEGEAQRSTDEEIDELYAVGKKEAIFNAAMQPVMMMVMMSVIFGILAVGIYRISTGSMAMGILISFLMYLFNLMGAVPVLASLFAEMAKAAGATKRIRELFLEDREDLTSGTRMDLAASTLEFKDVAFAYESDQDILKQVSFSAQPNEVVAFAGPSGGGKSTIFNLIERFYEPDKGTITVGGQDIKNLELANYRQQIGYVTQDSPMLFGTIRFNLTYGLEGEYRDEELWEVLKLAYAEKFVRALPKGLDTQIGERGMKLSGGQRQRIAIARVFLRNPKILMLDEATASLDSESEMALQKALKQLMAGRMTLLIAHRLATIVDADKIYFIEDGQVTGSGQHEELLASHPTYAQYVAKQFHLSDEQIAEASVEP